MINKYPLTNTISSKLALDSAPPGTRVRVTELPPGRHRSGRLANLGIGPGTELEVLSVYPFRGPVIVRIDGNPVAIGRGLARKITVETI